MPREKKKLSAKDDDTIITADDNSSGSDEGTTRKNKKQRRGGTTTEIQTETDTDKNKKQKQLQTTTTATTTTTTTKTTPAAAKAVIDASNNDNNNKVASKLKIKTDMSDSTTTTTTTTTINTNKNTNTDIMSASNNNNSTSNNNNNNNKQQPVIKLTPTAGGSGSAMDNHPYARGAVIEVLHGVKEKNNNDDDENESSDSSSIEDEYENKDCDNDDDDNDDDFDEWWDKDSDVEEDDDDKGDNDIDNDKEDNMTDEKGEEDKSAKEGVISVRLCDIIDRVSIEHQHHHHKSSSNDNNSTTAPSTTTTTTTTTIWRYYVHYRDFNRRMDEWISMDRIVSPPSIGNAKARAIKREEEKKKRLIQREKEKEEKRKAAIEARSVDVTAPRASRRRSTTNNAGGTTTSSTTTTAMASTTTTTSSGSGTSANNNDYNSGSSAQITGSTNNSSSNTGNNNNAEDGHASDGGGGANTAAAEEGTRRGTRLRRKKADAAADDDDKTVVAGNNNNTNNNTNTAGIGGLHFNDGGAVISVGVHIPVIATAVSLPTIVAEHSDRRTKVGGHGIVQTIAAQELDEHEGLDEASLREHEEVTKVKNVAFLELGAHQMSTWYFSPLPKELLSERGYIEVLYVCEFTLRMFSRKSEIRRFQSRLPVDRRHPPGNEIYRKGNLSMFEVDGFEEKIYCQNLCYIAKLFLDHKTLYFDVDPFLFYVLCEVDERGFHPVGYYSKEKFSDVGYNLACILTFPSHQRKGYGRFLIAFSYELSKKEEKVGSPEKPMSDLGQQAYKPYWASTIVDFLLNQCPNASMSIMDISKMTSIMAEDIVFTLNQLSILKIINGVYFIAAEEGLLRTLAKKYPVKQPRVDATKLHWTPFVMEVKRDKFSIHSKKPSVEGEETRGAGGF